MIDEIDSWILRALARVTIGKIADLSWPELTARRAAHDVIAQRVAYGSRNPAGEPATLTGLVAFPVIAADPGFRPRDRVVVLSHATGSTPSSLSEEDGWLVLATLIAGRGYLVIAPDNFGRGGSATDPVDGTRQPETYLMANRVAINTLDMVAAGARKRRLPGFPRTRCGRRRAGHRLFPGRAQRCCLLACRPGRRGGIHGARAIQRGAHRISLYQTVRGAIGEAGRPLRRQSVVSQRASPGRRYPT